MPTISMDGQSSMSKDPSPMNSPLHGAGGGLGQHGDDIPSELLLRICDAIKNNPYPYHYDDQPPSSSSVTTTTKDNNNNNNNNNNNSNLYQNHENNVIALCKEYVLQYDINIQYKQGLEEQSLLHFCCEYGYFLTAKFLLENANVSVDLRCIGRDQSILTLLCNQDVLTPRMQRFIQYLLTRRVTVQPISLACLLQRPILTREEVMLSLKLLSHVVLSDDALLYEVFALFVNRYRYVEENKWIYVYLEDILFNLSSLTPFAPALVKLNLYLTTFHHYKEIYDKINIIIDEELTPQLIYVEKLDPQLFSLDNLIHNNNNNNNNNNNTNGLNNVSNNLTNFSSPSKDNLLQCDSFCLDAPLKKKDSPKNGDTNNNNNFSFEDNNEKIANNTYYNILQQFPTHNPILRLFQFQFPFTTTTKMILQKLLHLQVPILYKHNHIEHIVSYILNQYNYFLYTQNIFQQFFLKFTFLYQPDVFSTNDEGYVQTKNIFTNFNNDNNNNNNNNDNNNNNFLLDSTASLTTSKRVIPDSVIMYQIQIKPQSALHHIRSEVAQIPTMNLKNFDLLSYVVTLTEAQRFRLQFRSVDEKVLDDLRDLVKRYKITPYDLAQQELKVPLLDENNNNNNNNNNSDSLLLTNNNSTASNIQNNNSSGDLDNKKDKKKKGDKDEKDEKKKKKDVISVEVRKKYLLKLQIQQEKIEENDTMNRGVQNSRKATTYNATAGMGNAVLGHNNNNNANGTNNEQKRLNYEHLTWLTLPYYGQGVVLNNEDDDITQAAREDGVLSNNNDENNKSGDNNKKDKKIDKNKMKNLLNANGNPLYITSKAIQQNVQRYNILLRRKIDDYLEVEKKSLFNQVQEKLKNEKNNNNNNETKKEKKEKKETKSFFGGLKKIFGGKKDDDDDDNKDDEELSPEQMLTLSFHPQPEDVQQMLTRDQQTDLNRYKQWFREVILPRLFLKYFKKYLIQNNIHYTVYSENVDYAMINQKIYALIQHDLSIVLKFNDTFINKYVMAPPSDTPVTKEQQQQLDAQKKLDREDEMKKSFELFNTILNDDDYYYPTSKQAEEQQKQQKNNNSNNSNNLNNNIVDFTDYKALFHEYLLISSITKENMDILFQYHMELYRRWGKVQNLCEDHMVLTDLVMKYNLNFMSIIFDIPTRFTYDMLESIKHYSLLCYHQYYKEKQDYNLFLKNLQILLKKKEEQDEQDNNFNNITNNNNNPNMPFLNNNQLLSQPSLETTTSTNLNESQVDQIKTPFTHHNTAGSKKKKRPLIDKNNLPTYQSKLFTTKTYDATFQHNILTEILEDLFVMTNLSEKNHSNFTKQVVNLHLDFHTIVFFAKKVHQFNLYHEQSLHDLILSLLINISYNVDDIIKNFIIIDEIIDNIVILAEEKEKKDKENGINTVKKDTNTNNLYELTIKEKMKNFLTAKFYQQIFSFTLIIPKLFHLISPSLYYQDMTIHPLTMNKKLQLIYPSRLPRERYGEYDFLNPLLHRLPYLLTTNLNTNINPYFILLIYHYIYLDYTKATFGIQSLFNTTKTTMVPLTTSTGSTAPAALSDGGGGSKKLSPHILWQMNPAFITNSLRVQLIFLLTTEHSENYSSNVTLFLQHLFSTAPLNIPGVDEYLLLLQTLSNLLGKQANNHFVFNVNEKDGLQNQQQQLENKAQQEQQQDNNNLVTFHTLTYLTTNVLNLYARRQLIHSNELWSLGNLFILYQYLTVLETWLVSSNNMSDADTMFYNPHGNNHNNKYQNNSIGDKHDNNNNKNNKNNKKVLPDQQRDNIIQELVVQDAGSNKSLGSNNDDNDKNAPPQQTDFILSQTQQPNLFYSPVFVLSYLLPLLTLNTVLSNSISPIHHYSNEEGVGNNAQNNNMSGGGSDNMFDDNPFDNDFGDDNNNAPATTNNANSNPFDFPTLNPGTNAQPQKVFSNGAEWDNEKIVLYIKKLLIKLLKIKKLIFLKKNVNFVLDEQIQAHMTNLTNSNNNNNNNQNNNQSNNNAGDDENNNNNKDDVKVYLDEEEYKKTNILSQHDSNDSLSTAPQIHPLSTSINTVPLYLGEYIFSQLRYDPKLNTSLDYRNFNPQILFLLLQLYRDPLVIRYKVVIPTILLLTQNIPHLVLLYMCMTFDTYQNKALHKRDYDLFKFMLVLIKYSHNAIVLNNKNNHNNQNNNKSIEKCQESAGFDRYLDKLGHRLFVNYHNTNNSNIINNNTTANNTHVVMNMLGQGNNNDNNNNTIQDTTITSHLFIKSPYTNNKNKSTTLHIEVLNEEALDTQSSITVLATPTNNNNNNNNNNTTPTNILKPQTTQYTPSLSTSNAPTTPLPAGLVMKPKGQEFFTSFHTTLPLTYLHNNIMRYSINDLDVHQMQNSTISASLSPAVGPSGGGEKKQQQTKSKTPIKNSEKIFEKTYFYRLLSSTPNKYTAKILILLLQSDLLFINQNIIVDTQRLSKYGLNTTSTTITTNALQQQTTQMSASISQQSQIPTLDLYYDDITWGFPTLAHQSVYYIYLAKLRDQSDRFKSRQYYVVDKKVQENKNTQDLSTLLDENVYNIFFFENNNNNNQARKRQQSAFYNGYYKTTSLITPEQLKLDKDKLKDDRHTNPFIQHPAAFLQVFDGLYVMYQDNKYNAYYNYGSQRDFIDQYTAQGIFPMTPSTYQFYDVLYDYIIATLYNSQQQHITKHHHVILMLLFDYSNKFLINYIYKQVQVLNMLEKESNNKDDIDDKQDNNTQQTKYQKLKNKVLDVYKNKHHKNIHSIHLLNEFIAQSTLQIHDNNQTQVGLVGPKDYLVGYTPTTETATTTLVDTSDLNNTSKNLLTTVPPVNNVDNIHNYQYALKPASTKRIEDTHISSTTNQPAEALPIPYFILPYNQYYEPSIFNLSTTMCYFFYHYKPQYNQYAVKFVTTFLKQTTFASFNMLLAFFLSPQQQYNYYYNQIFKDLLLPALTLTPTQWLTTSLLTSLNSTTASSSLNLLAIFTHQYTFQYLLQQAEVAKFLVAHKGNTGLLTHQLNTLPRSGNMKQQRMNCCLPFDVFYHLLSTLGASFCDLRDFDYTVLTNNNDNNHNNEQDDLYGGSEDFIREKQYKFYYLSPLTSYSDKSNVECFDYFDQIVYNYSKHDNNNNNNANNNNANNNTTNNNNTNASNNFTFNNNNSLTTTNNNNNTSLAFNNNNSGSKLLTTTAAAQPATLTTSASASKLTTTNNNNGVVTTTNNNNNNITAITTNNNNSSSNSGNFPAHGNIRTSQPNSPILPARHRSRGASVDVIRIKMSLFQTPEELQFGDLTFDIDENKQYDGNVEHKAAQKAPTTTKIAEVPNEDSNNNSSNSGNQSSALRTPIKGRQAAVTITNASPDRALLLQLQQEYRENELDKQHELELKRRETIQQDLEAEKKKKFFLKQPMIAESSSSQQLALTRVGSTKSVGSMNLTELTAKLTPQQVILYQKLTSLDPLLHFQDFFHETFNDQLIDFAHNNITTLDLSNTTKLSSSTTTTTKETIYHLLIEKNLSKNLKIIKTQQVLKSLYFYNIKYHFPIVQLNVFDFMRANNISFDDLTFKKVFFTKTYLTKIQDENKKSAIQQTIATLRDALYQKFNIFSLQSLLAQQKTKEEEEEEAEEDNNNNSKSSGNNNNLLRYNKKALTLHPYITTVDGVNENNDDYSFNDKQHLIIFNRLKMFNKTTLLQHYDTQQLSTHIVSPLQANVTYPNIVLALCSYYYVDPNDFHNDIFKSQTPQQQNEDDNQDAEDITKPLQKEQNIVVKHRQQFLSALLTPDVFGVISQGDLVFKFCYFFKYRQFNNYQQFLHIMLSLIGNEDGDDEENKFKYKQCTQSRAYAIIQQIIHMEQHNVVNNYHVFDQHAAYHNNISNINNNDKAFNFNNMDTSRNAHDIVLDSTGLHNNNITTYQLLQQLTLEVFLEHCMLSFETNKHLLTKSTTLTTTTTTGTTTKALQTTFTPTFAAINNKCVNQTICIGSITGNCAHINCNKNFKIINNTLRKPFIPQQTQAKMTQRKQQYNNQIQKQLMNKESGGVGKTDNNASSSSNAPQAAQQKAADLIMLTAKTEQIQTRKNNFTAALAQSSIEMTPPPQPMLFYEMNTFVDCQTTESLLFFFLYNVYQPLAQDVSFLLAMNTTGSSAYQLIQQQKDVDLFYKNNNNNNKNNNKNSQRAFNINILNPIHLYTYQNILMLAILRRWPEDALIELYQHFITQLFLYLVDEQQQQQQQKEKTVNFAAVLSFFFNIVDLHKHNILDYVIHSDLQHNAPRFADIVFRDYLYYLEITGNTK